VISVSGYIIGIIGCWLFCDGWISLSLYVGKPNQGWLKDHIIRVIRLALGVALMVMGAML
jgi:hypothetical protein